MKHSMNNEQFCVALFLPPFSPTFVFSPVFNFSLFPTFRPFWSRRASAQAILFSARLRLPASHLSMLEEPTEKITCVLYIFLGGYITLGLGQPFPVTRVATPRFRLRFPYPKILHSPGGADKRRFPKGSEGRFVVR